MRRRGGIFPFVPFHLNKHGPLAGLKLHQQTKAITIPYDTATRWNVIARFPFPPGGEAAPFCQTAVGPGNSTVTTNPPSAEVLKPTRLLCCCATALTMESPNPLPLCI